MILVNELQQTTYELNHSSIRTLLLLIAPFAPHLAEELWSLSDGNSSIHNQKWPEYNSKFIKEEKFQLIIQINGRVRDKMEVLADISEDEAKELVLEREKVKPWLGGKEIKKIIFVPGKLINIVV